MIDNICINASFSFSFFIPELGGKCSPIRSHRIMFKIFSIATLVYSECTIALVNFRKSITVNSVKKAYKLLDQN